MCPTLEQILARSLMRGRMPGVPNPAGTLQSLSPVPSLKVPTLRSPHQQNQQQQQQEQQGRGVGKSNEKTATSNAGGGRSALAEQDIAAFAGLSAPVFEEDAREHIYERPERRGLRSLQDLAELVRSACVLGEHQSAMQAVREGFLLAADEIHQSARSNTKAASSSSSSSVADISNALDRLVPVGHLSAVAACAREQTGSAAAFEDFLDGALFAQQKRFAAAVAAEEAAASSSKLKSVQEAISQRWCDMGTEALVNSGEWIAALQRFQLMCTEGRGTVASLNACINGLSAPKQWEAALALAMPAIQLRKAQQLGAAVASVAQKAEEAAAAAGTSSSSSAQSETDEQEQEGKSGPLSRRGQALDDAGARRSQQQPSSQQVAADAVTFAALVSTLESCGRTKEAHQVLEGAPRAERDAVMASYVALLQVWGEKHGTKLRKRF